MSPPDGHSNAWGVTFRQPASVPNAATIIVQVAKRFVRLLVMFVNLLSLVG